MDADSETFIVHIAIREWEEMTMDLKWKAQIETQIEAQSKAQSRVYVRALLFDEVPTEVPAEYPDYSEVFLAENAVELPENSRINEHAIELEEGKQPFFGLIYSLGLV